MIASFSHPNIVRILDVFEENDTAYYVMELLSGGSMADKIKREGPLNESTAELFIRQIADALSYVHAHNTVHLDIKPSNILFNNAGQATLIDFGISKHYDDSGEQTSSSPIGYSPGYSPLEQSLTGDISQFKASTDIYSLGATLYYMVTGVTPPAASKLNEEGLIKPLNLSDKVWTIISIAMRPLRKDRYQSIGQFLKGFERESDDEYTTVSLPEDKNKPDNKAKPFWFRGLSITLSIIGLLFLGAFFYFSTNKQKNDKSGIEKGHEFVDLGLSVMWSTCYVGAQTPQEFGSLFAWGEIDSKNSFVPVNYKFWESGSDFGDSLKFSKYSIQNSDTESHIELDLLDDAAFVNWGGRWRMPTESELSELIHSCTWEKQDGGFLVTSNINGNSIFIAYMPVLSYGYKGQFWTSSLSDNSKYAIALVDRTNNILEKPICPRTMGLFVRPVLDYSLEDDSHLSKVLGYGSLRVNFKPSDSHIWLDGTFAGNHSPLVLDSLREGQHMISIRSNKHADVNSVVQIEPNSNCIINETLNSDTKSGVDMGVSVKWASCNIGAHSITDPGNFFAWGETSIKDDYSWDNYKYCISYNKLDDIHEDIKLSKYYYSWNSQTGDNKITLDASDDAARALWGSKWRIPTAKEFQELRDNCMWTLAVVNNVELYKATSKINGNSIYFPYTGYWSGLHYYPTAYIMQGCYWTSVNYANVSSFQAEAFIIRDSSIKTDFRQKCNGFAIRPVMD